MQIRCKVCSTEFVVGDEVVRALRARHGTIPCSKCKVPILLEGPKPTEKASPPYKTGEISAAPAVKPATTIAAAGGLAVKPSPVTANTGAAAGVPVARPRERLQPRSMFTPSAPRPLATSARASSSGGHGTSKPPTLPTHTSSPEQTSPKGERPKPPPLPAGPPTSTGHRPEPPPVPTARTVHERPAGIAPLPAPSGARWPIPSAIVADVPSDWLMPEPEEATPTRVKAPEVPVRPLEAAAPLPPPPLPEGNGTPSSIPTMAAAASAMTIPTSPAASSTSDERLPGSSRRVRRTRIGAAAAVLIGATTFWVALRGRSQHSYVASRETAKPPASAARPIVTTAESTTPTPSLAPLAAAPPATPAERPPTPTPEPAPRENEASAPTPAKKILPSLTSSKAPRPAALPERAAETDPTDPGAAPRGKGSINDDALQEALAQGAERAKGCHVQGGPTGTARVTVTFAPSGEVTGVSVGGAFANSIEASCIAAKFRTLHVPPFVGADVIVRKTFSIE